MPRPITDPTLTGVHFRLGAATLKALDEIAREQAKRTGGTATRTDAVRWAVRELRARLWMEKTANTSVAVTLDGPGPMTAPEGGPKAP